jgi:ribosomal protein S18 acetylase RimI-like enzyme
VPRADHLFAVITDESTGEIVGCTELGMMPAPEGYAAATRIAYIGNVAVGSSQRRRGIGRRLVGFAVKWARSRWDRADVFTSVEATNGAAFALYAALGFRRYELDPTGPSEREGKLLLVRRGSTQPKSRGQS